MRVVGLPEVEVRLGSRALGLALGRLRSLRYCTASTNTVGFSECVDRPGLTVISGCRTRGSQ